MRVLWFTNIPLPDGCKAIGIQPYVKGGWMSSLADALAKTGSVELAVVTVMQGAKDVKFKINNITHYIVSARISTRVFKNLSREVISACKGIQDDFRPDIVHIHGTERFYGLLSAKGCIKCPTVISIQGLIHVYAKYYYGGLSLEETLLTRSPADWLFTAGLIYWKLQWRDVSRQELEIIKNNRFFIGRTDWDRAHLQAVNPKAKYYHCDELLRHEFYQQTWDISKIRRHSIFVPTGSYPLKGFHWVLHAASILKYKFPDLLVRVADSSIGHDCSSYNWYAKYLKRLICRLKLEDHIVPLGLLSAREMALELSFANVFVVPSLVENGCNALQEAMLVGAPSVVSYAGGMTNMIKDGETALCFSPGDEAMLADRISAIFINDDLARKLSLFGRQVALQRNHEETIVKKMLGVYEDVCKVSADTHFKHSSF